MSEVAKVESEQEFAEEVLEVRTDIEAGWQLDRRNTLIKDRDELIAFYKEQIRQVEEDAEYKLTFIDRALYAYFMTKKHQKTATQEYVKLPGGKLMLKKQNPEYKRDDKTVIEWLKANGQERFVKVEEKLDWAGLKAATVVCDGRIATTDGEFVPGVEVTEREAKFTIE